MSTFDSAPVGPGIDETVSILGGSAIVGGLDATFPVAGGGTFTAELIQVSIADFAQLVMSGLDEINFGLITDPLLFWDLSYDGNFTAPVEMVFRYDGSTVVPPYTEADLAIYHFENGEWERLDGVLDPANDTITVDVYSLSLFALGGSILVPALGIWGMSGLALAMLLGTSWVVWRRALRT